MTWSSHVVMVADIHISEEIFTIDILRSLMSQSTSVHPPWATPGD